MAETQPCPFLLLTLFSFTLFHAFSTTKIDVNYGTVTDNFARRQPSQLFSNPKPPWTKWNSATQTHSLHLRWHWWCFSADIGWCYFWIILARVFFFSRIWYLAYVSESFLANIDWWWFSTDIGWGYFWSMLVTVLFWSMSSEAIFLPTSARVFGRHRWWLFFYLHLLGFWSTSIMTIFFVDID